MSAKGILPTLSTKCNFPPWVLDVMIKWLENRKHCRTASRSFSRPIVNRPTWKKIVYSSIWLPLRKNQNLTIVCQNLTGMTYLQFFFAIMGRHGILIFSCLLFVLFEKTNPDFLFDPWLSLCYTMVGLGIYCPTILWIQKIAEVG